MVAVFILDLIYIEFFKTMKTVKYIFLMAIGFFTVSCESNSYAEISGTVVANPTYEANVKAIIQNNCLSCHSVTTDNELPNLEGYAAVKDATQNGALLSEIAAPSGQGMPEAGRMPQVQINIITTWAAQGYVQQ
jgi:cytochrome c551/c552